MRTFSIIYWVNVVWLSITLILYTTVIYGMLAQVVLGGIQILSSFLLLFYWKNIWEHDKKHVYYYWLLVLTFFLSVVIMASFDGFHESLSVFGLIIIPMSIGLYFMYILYRLNSKFKRDSLNNQVLT